ncbi:hypothetical protein MKW92_036697 [Papaver armeniacum]|nr:hypothetical protein MKW92_036697 [Papaver armeniacum]
MVMAIVISVILLFVGIGVLVMVHVCIVGRAFRRGFDSENNANVNHHQRGGNNRSNNSMSHDDLEKLPCYEFKSLEKETSSPVDCCVVCLETFKMGEKCRLLPLCKHSFHAQCVDSWLLKTPICPICRTSAGNSHRREETISSAENEESSSSGGEALAAENEESSSSGGEVLARSQMNYSNSAYAVTSPFPSASIL